MSRERFIDPHFFRSESVSRLSIEARLTLVGMIATADDHGRGRGSPRAVQLEVFPAGDATVERVGEWIKEIEKAGIARFYLVNGDTYYDLPNWEKYQQPKYVARSKIPDFPGEHPEAYRHPLKPGQNPGRSVQNPGRSGRNLEQGGEGRDDVSSLERSPKARTKYTHTPPTRARGRARCVCVPASPPREEDPLEKSWSTLIEEIPKKKPWIKDPVAWVFSVRKSHPGRTPEQIFGTKDKPGTNKKQSDKDLLEEYWRDFHGKQGGDDRKAEKSQG